LRRAPSARSVRSIGFLSNPMLLWGIAFELAFTAGLVYLPVLQDAFGTASLGPAELGLLALFGPLVWATDEVARARRRRRVGVSGLQTRDDGHETPHSGGDQ
jgi:hypothetical protein